MILNANGHANGNGLHDDQPNDNGKRRRLLGLLFILIILLISFSLFESKNKEEGDFVVGDDHTNKYQRGNNNNNNNGNFTTKITDPNSKDSSSSNKTKRKRYYPHSKEPSLFVNFSEPYIEANSTIELKKKGYKFIGKTGFIDIDYQPDVPFGPCRPKNCSVPIHFLSDKNMWKHAVALSSYPGSGNTWTRYLLQQGSRLWTGSVFCDSKLRFDGFFAECMTQRDIPFKTIATKTHYPAFGGATFARVGFKAPTAAIFILRAPFEAILSFFTLKTARTLGGGDFHVAKLPTSYYSGHAFKAFVKMAAQKWVRHLDMINGPHPMGKNGKVIPILLVNYENLVYKFVPEIRRVFYFLREVLELGDRMPSVEEALMCASRQTEGAEHRSHKEIFNPFNEELIHIVCNMTAKYWNDDLYGPCNGQLQEQRKLTKLPVPPVPKDVCST